jgi:tetratricopeptide (TPR) repeat protein
MKTFNQQSWLSSLLLLGLVLLPYETLANPEDQVQYYISNYGGRVDAEDKWVRRVSKVFEKVSLVADKRHHRQPQLTVIKGFNNPDEPLALALPDGHIVLSKAALNLIYNNVSPTLGDTRAAFVLGHELAHLAKDDFWHREFLKVTQRNDSLHQLIKHYRDDNGKNKEIEADDRGFIYAAMAGYPVDELLADGPQPFLVYWQQQTFQGLCETHLPAEKRAALLRLRLQKLLESLPYFHFGVRLSHFDRCDDAVYFFQAFSTEFPSHEVYNNLGLCELQRARQALGKAAYSYWLPSVLEATTQLEDLSLPDVRRGEQANAKEFLINAAESFEFALEMAPYYVAANVNLAITALYLNNIYEARAAIEKARQLAPDDLEIQGLRAVILYEEGRQSPYIDMWPKSIELLESLAQQPNVPLSVWYNTARLLELRKRTGAEEFWQKLAPAELPPPIRRIVCEKTACPAPQPQKPQAVWNLPVKLGVRTKRHKTLRQWQTTPFRLYDLREQIYQHPNGSAEVLALKRRVEMVVLKKLGAMTKEDLAAYCGQPLRQREVVNGTIWTCQDWAALVVDERVKEVWVVKSSISN